MTESGVAEVLDPVNDIPSGEEAADEAVADNPVHQATCTHPTCKASVVFRLTPSGHGFAILEQSGVEDDEIFTMGPGGGPECPRGHGELKLTDDMLPAAEAIMEADARLRQASLPGIVPDFNYQGAYLELETMAVEVDRLKREYDNDAAVAKDAKKRWDRAAETYTKAALELRRRRREKIENGDAIADLAPEGEQQELAAEPETPAEASTIGAQEAPAEPEVAHRYPKRGKKKTRTAPVHPQPKKRAKKK